MININNIDDLIGKFLSGEASPEEAMLLEDWKNDHPDNLLYYSNSEKMFSLFHNENVAGNSDSKLAWEKIKNKIEVPVKIIPVNRKASTTWWAAASIIFVIGIGLMLSYLFQTKKQQEIVYTATNEAKDVQLRDGTSVRISSHSNLLVDENFGNTNRTVHLTGSADFSVVHEEKLPFIVDAGNVFIKDIGTEFNVRSSADTDTVYVKVNKGIVLLFDSLGESLEIKATEKALYIRSIKKIVQVGAPTSINANVRFVNTSLKEVVMKLNSVYDTNIILENDQLNDCTITTHFEKEDLETILGIITETLGLGYEKTPSGYVIKGQSCQNQ